MTAFLSWTLLGLLAGGLAKLIMPGKDPGGCLVTIAIGVAGAYLGGFIGGLLFDTDPIAGFSLSSLLVATLGSILLLLAYRLVVRRREPPV